MVNAPTTFQKVSEYDQNVQSLVITVLTNLNIRIALVYDNDVLETSKGFDEHVHLFVLGLNKSQESKSQTASLKMKICHKTSQILRSYSFQIWQASKSIKH